MNDFTDQIQKIEEFNTILEKYYEEKYDSSYCKDGIVNIEEYFNSNERILWILKDTNGMGGNDMREYLNDLKNPDGSLWGARTFQNIVYSTYGILNKKKYTEIPDYYNDKKVIDITRKIAYINIKKAEGGNVALKNELLHHYNEDKYYILKQIELFMPTIIIGGYTFAYLKEDMRFNESDGYRYKYVGEHLGVHMNNKLLLLDAYHPNQRRINKITYCDSLITEYLNWREKYPLANASL